VCCCGRLCSCLHCLPQRLQGCHLAGFSPTRGNIVFWLVLLNPLPHGVLATFSLTAGGPIGLPKKDDISWEQMLLMTSLRTHRAFAMRRKGLPNTYPPPPIQRHGEFFVYIFLCLHHNLSHNFLRRKSL
jgi:hypothetical protein